MKRTFVEKILNAERGSIVYREPDIVLSHDNSARIRELFEKIEGRKVLKPQQLVVVLDQKMTGSDKELKCDYDSIHRFMEEQRVDHFFDCDRGICHQVLVEQLKQGLLVVGSDSHTCTAGAFNCLAVGLNKTETAVLWKTGKMWFRVPETIKIILKKSLPEGVYAKDLALWVMGVLKNEHADYCAIEYHGSGVSTLSIADRMTVANISAEMGVKNSAFPPDDSLADYFGNYAVQGVWADENAVYSREIEIDLSGVCPLMLATHEHNQVRSINPYEKIQVQRGFIGACSNGRLEDLRVVARILKGKTIFPGFQLFVVPASRDIYLKAFEEGLIDTIMKSGATVLGASCSPCMSSRQKLLGDNRRFITTTNINTTDLVEEKIEKYVASPATVAMTALCGEIHSETTTAGFFHNRKQYTESICVAKDDIRKYRTVWYYGDLDNITCEQLFAKEQSKNIPTGEPVAMQPYLLAGLDGNFAGRVQSGDIVVAGENFGCGSLVKHGALGLVEAGVKIVIAKSVARDFFRMATNCGLWVIINREIVEAYRPGAVIIASIDADRLFVDMQEFLLPQVAPEYVRIIRKRGIVNAFR